MNALVNFGQKNNDLDISLLDYDLEFDFNGDDVLADSQESKTLDFDLQSLDRLWRAGNKELCESVPIDPKVYSLRRNIDGSLAEDDVSLYDVVNKKQDMQDEADEFFEFMIYEAPWDVSKEVPLLLNLIAVLDTAKTSDTVSKFIHDISKSNPQDPKHIRAHHWQIDYCNKQDSLEIRSLLAHSSKLYKNNKSEVNKEMVKIRAKERREAKRIKKEMERNGKKL